MAVPKAKYFFNAPNRTKAATAAPRRRASAPGPLQPPCQSNSEYRTTSRPRDPHCMDVLVHDAVAKFVYKYKRVRSRACLPSLMLCNSTDAFAIHLYYLSHISKREVEEKTQSISRHHIVII